MKIILIVKIVFYYRGVPRTIEDFFVNYSVKLTELMCEFLQQKFEIKYGNYGWEFVGWRNGFFIQWISGIA